MSGVPGLYLMQKDRDKKIRLDGKTIRVGSGDDNELCIKGDPLVSPSHCRFVDGVIEDVSSTAGRTGACIWVNDIKYCRNSDGEGGVFWPQRGVREGDTIRFGMGSDCFIKGRRRTRDQFEASFRVARARKACERITKAIKNLMGEGFHPVTKSYLLLSVKNVILNPIGGETRHRVSLACEEASECVFRFQTMVRAVLKRLPSKIIDIILRSMSDIAIMSKESLQRTFLDLYCQYRSTESWCALRGLGLQCSFCPGQGAKRRQSVIDLTD